MMIMGGTLEEKAPINYRASPFHTEERHEAPFTCFVFIFSS